MPVRVPSQATLVLLTAITGCGNSGIGLTPCDPFADECDTGDRCAMVFEFDAADEISDSGFFCAPSGEVAENGLCRGISTGDLDGGRELVTDDCGAGLFCATLDEERRCRAFCDGDAFGCGGAEFCRGLAMEPLLAVCTQADACDAIEQNCGADRGCYAISGGEGSLLTHCFDFAPPPNGTGEVGTTCQFTGDCAPGADCFPDPTDSGRLLCQAFCERDAGCPAEEACVPIPNLSETQSGLGVCE